MRNIIVGDIHGCFKAFQALLKKLGLSGDSVGFESDRLILLGDLFDRGPESWEVFQEVRRLEEELGERFVLLRGNHDDYLLQERLPLNMRFVWEGVGRRSTVQSFKLHGDRMENAAPWLREHSVIFYRGEGFQCVHAGLKIDPPEANDTYTMLHDHGIVQQNRYNGPLTIVGHIALERPAWFAGDGQTVKVLEEEIWHDLPESGTICIDAGCGKGGRLVGMVIEDGKYILHSVPENGK